MNVTYLGHAGLRIETSRATILVDPWFSPEGAYQASWFQYPENQHLISPDLFTPTAIAISHEHLDHVDPWFLRQVPSHVPIIIPRYPSPALRRKVEAARPGNIVEVAPWVSVRVAEGTSLFFVSEDSPMNHDSAMVIVGDGYTFLNLNDARLSAVGLRNIRAKVGGGLDLLALQGSGASWYPMVYHFSDERKREISQGQRLAKFAYVLKAVRVVEPAMVLPFAGPPCFLDPELVQYNTEMVDGYFPEQHKVAEWLTDKGVSNTVVLRPGDAWNIQTRRKTSDPQWVDFEPSDRNAYLAAYAQRRRSLIESVRSRYPSPATSLWEPFREYFLRLLEMSPYFNRKINMRVGFQVTGQGGGEWTVDFRECHQGVERSLEGCAYRYQFESRWLPPILSGEVPWEDFFLSLRYRAWRDPDTYNDHLLSLLKFADPNALKAVEDYELSLNAEETFVLQVDDATYQVQRFCPHAGHDLRDTAEVVPGRALRCLSHYYTFDLESGRCLNSACMPLRTKRIV